MSAMKYITYSTDPTKEKFRVCILVPTINKQAIEKEYLNPFPSIDKEEVVVLSLYKPSKKTKVSIMKEYAEEIFEALIDIEPEYVIVGDADYFKILANKKSAANNVGYVIPHSKLNMNFSYVPNYASVFYDPEKITAEIASTMNNIVKHMNGIYHEPGQGITSKISIPHKTEDIINNLTKYMNSGKDITCDIETFSLKHYEAGIATIGFSLEGEEAFAFEIDLLPEKKKYLFDPEEEKAYRRQIIKEFFIHFPNRIYFHNASFDVMVLIYELFMEHLEDTAGLLYGLEVFMSKIEDTKLIAYLATNSCAGNVLGLKPLAQEFAGNYAVDVTDVKSVPIVDLLIYNGVDCLSTWYVKEKYYPIMVADNQLDVYQNIFRPALADIIQMQLTGMPICPERVQIAKASITKDFNKALATINSNKNVQEYIHTLKEEWAIKRNQELKKKRVTYQDAPIKEFNPDSDPQLQGLLFKHLGFPYQGLTPAGQPSTKGAVIEKLQRLTEDPDTKELLQAILDYKDAAIILSTFISAFEQAVPGPSGQHYLFGNFNLGGTVSGRLSSNGPNLQNIPATGSKYAKIIKQCFVAINGWLYVGLDFSSLEDRISALTTKDRNKLKVYTDGFDGHSLRAYSYFGDQMPDIDPDSVDSINSIQSKYKDFRQDSKVPTFLLTYGGTYIGIMDKMGWTQDKAKAVETKYHELYKESDEWVQAKLDEASKTGYVTVAFGLRVRTPLLAQVIRGTRVTPFEAEAEGRTAGNALGQSWGLLNTRAVTAFMKKVRKHSKYKLLIRPCAQIHDANYYIIKEDPELIVWMNEHLVQEVQWQDHPDIYHDQVKLGGELSLFFPSWAEELALPNQLDILSLSSLCELHMDDLRKKGII